MMADWTVLRSARSLAAQSAGGKADCSAAWSVQTMVARMAEMWGQSWAAHWAAQRAMRLEHWKVDLLAAWRVVHWALHLAGATVVRLVDYWAENSELP